MATGFSRFLVNIEGVLYYQNTPLPDARNFLSFLVKSDFEFLLVTNNSTAYTEEYTERIQALFDIALPSSRIFTAIQATGHYLSTIAAKGTKVMVIGEEPLLQEIESREFRLDDEEPEYIVVGLDREFNFKKLQQAMQAVYKHQAKLIGTNPEKSPDANLQDILGCGSILASLQAATGQVPLVIGMPNEIFFQFASSRFERQSGNAILVGHSEEIQIAKGKTEITTALIRRKIEDLALKPVTTIAPDYEFEDLGHFMTVVCQKA